VISVSKIKAMVEKGTEAQAPQVAATARRASQAASTVRASRFARDPGEFATATGVTLRVVPGGAGVVGDGVVADPCAAARGPSRSSVTRRGTANGSRPHSTHWSKRFSSA
jgi:hypothetical protein